MTAILFVPLLALTWMIGTAIASQAAHFFLTIIESSATPTAHGMNWRGPSFKAWMRDGINWPDETYADHFAKGAYLAYLIALWAGPAILIGRLVAGNSVEATVIAGTAFWLFFPIGLLSSLASASRWTPFWPGLIVAFAKRPVKTLAFYVLSAPILAVLVVTLDLVLIHTSKATVAWAAALSPVAAVSFFIYARLLGRLGLVVSFTRPPDPEDEADAKPRRWKKRKNTPHARDPQTRGFRPTEDILDDPAIDAQPPEMRGIITPNDGEVTGYAVDYSGKAPAIEEPKPPLIVHKFDDEDDEPIVAAPPPEISDERRQVAERIANAPEHEIALYLPSRVTEPTNPYGADAVTFLFDLKTLGPWLTLTAGLIVMALLQRALDMLRPD